MTEKFYPANARARDPSVAGGGAPAAKTRGNGSHVVVIGAGIAGLTAAYRLQQAGMRVTVLEAAGMVGGRMGDRRSGEIVFNSGARLIYPFGRVFNRLIADLALGDALIPLRNLSARCVTPRGDHLIELMPTARSLMTPGLPMGERLALIAHGVRMRLQRGRVDPDWAVSALDVDPEADRLTLADYIRGEIGPHALASLVDPVFRATRSFNAETLSSLFYRTTVPHLVGEDTVHTLRGGMGFVCQTLAGQLDVRTGARVASVEHRREAGVLRVAVTLADGGMLAADHVVCAVEGSLAGALIRTPQTAEREMLAQVRYNALGVVHYGFAQPLPALMQFASRDIASRISTFQQMPAAPASGRPLTQLYCQLTPEAVEEVRRRGCTDDIDTLLRDELRARIPDFDRHVVAVVNQWIPRKLPVFAPGYGERLRAFWHWQEDPARASERPVVYCGDWTSQALLTGACASGERAARIVLDRAQIQAKRTDS
ncbi:protoporphyrinogen/coproporphyrinogen oxidase [Paraburkholderia susongensis]|uniref:Oxygen-dependent protoporphyrinogen oxidase n=1 Tax=Paraburkholderia susongensis TaxID=1515439 RepID=A0A1X7L7C5_9BURK|nr:NAD(P)/FAD-dependent oxidoreductase [Paraburkholderia susongensis]SMG49660.1 oxygen-dependent protoporphyrinogen oxidase [Paraburkholderia susongensis]